MITWAWLVPAMTVGTVVWFWFVDVVARWDCRRKERARNRRRWSEAHQQQHCEEPSWIYEERL